MLGLANSADHWISEFVDLNLQSHVQTLPSYLQDTTDFLKKQEALGPIPPDALLVSMDVTSLYTNIPHSDGIKACEEAWEERDIKDPPTQTLVKVLTLVLKCNNIESNGQQYCIWKCLLNISVEAKKVNQVLFKIRWWINKLFGPRKFIKILTVNTLNARLLTLKSAYSQMYVFIRPLKYLKPHKQTVYGPRSDCSYRSSLIWVHSVFLYAYVK